MIIKLEFDMFYTIIKTPDIAEKELRQGLYNAFERWLKKQQCYAVKKVLYDEDAVFAPFPVGRLDKDTEGLLLITNDGELAHQLLSPKKHVDKVYFARIDGKVTEEDIRRFAEGLEIGEEKPTLPAYLEILESEEISEIRLTFREGKFHQVKRMFHAVGKEVIYLKRLQMGSLVLDPQLALGEYRELTGQELEALRDCSSLR